VIALATEAWPAVFGGLIPIIGLAGGAYLIYRAVKDDDGNDEDE
jgi:threonine/homoserine/homoserine lactone efflux protein